MRYFIILLMLVGLVGCGGGSSDGDKKAPASPKTDDRPPSVPNI